MQRTWLWKTVSCLGTFLILYTIHIIRVPQATAEAYKLGKVYYNCLETHSGAVSSSTGCSCATDKECLARGHGRYCNTSINICQQCKDGRDDNWCRDNFGEDYICMNGMCAIAECETTPDCTAKMGHMFSCNTISHRCYVSCNWDIITAQGKGYIAGTSINMADFLNKEMATFDVPFTSSTYSRITAIQLNSRKYPAIMTNSLYTCIGGEVVKCPEVTRSSTVTEDQICIPCSMASGGTYGHGSTDASDAGPMAYFGNFDYSSTVNPYFWLTTSGSTGGGWIGYGGISPLFCLTKEGLNSSKNLAARFKDAHAIVGWEPYIPKYSLENGYIVGQHPRCWAHGLDPLFQMHDTTNLKTTGIRFVQMIDRKNTCINIYSGTEQGKIIRNVSAASGLVLCCSGEHNYTSGMPSDVRLCTNVYPVTTVLSCPSYIEDDNR